MLRTFLIAIVVGAAATLAALAGVRLFEAPDQPAQLERSVGGGSIERWSVGAQDRLAVTGDVPQPLPAGIGRPAEARLAGLTVATMKVRDVRGEVIGVASRIGAAERAGGPRAVWWTFVMGARGTLAAHLPDEREPAAGRLIGGTRTFEGATGRFAEAPHAAGGYLLQIARPRSAEP